VKGLAEGLAESVMGGADGCEGGWRRKYWGGRDNRGERE